MKKEPIEDRGWKPAPIIFMWLLAGVVTIFSWFIRREAVIESDITIVGIFGPPIASVLYTIINLLQR